MVKEVWIQHIEKTEGIIRPSINPEMREKWAFAVRSHASANCPVCKERQKTYRANIYRKQREQVMRDCGLAKCRFNGRTFWE